MHLDYCNSISAVCPELSYLNSGQSSQILLYLSKSAYMSIHLTGSLLRTEPNSRSSFSLAGLCQLALHHHTYESCLYQFQLSQVASRFVQPLMEIFWTLAAVRQHDCTVHSRTLVHPFGTIFHLTFEIPLYTLLKLLFRSIRQPCSLFF